MMADSPSLRHWVRSRCFVMSADLVPRDDPADYRLLPIIVGGN